ncbi:MAG: hypothetical protein QOH06_1035 [Acidobacteriota bacterium]|jgi:hypothetical protein|nr:hypothetical protein [Acidobacteriota bacterium]
MIIRIKYDNLNGEVGASPSFSQLARQAIDTFRERIQENSGYIPRNPGADFPFVSFLAAFGLPSEEAVVLIWAYVSRELLRNTVSFMAFFLPAQLVNPLAVAKGILIGDLKKSALEAIRGRCYEIDIPDWQLGHPLSTVHRDSEILDPLALRLLPESEILSESDEEFTPFISFKPENESIRGPSIAAAVSSLSAPVGQDGSSMESRSEDFLPEGTSRPINQRTDFAGEKGCQSDDTPAEMKPDLRPHLLRKSSAQPIGTRLFSWPSIGEAVLAPLLLALGFTLGSLWMKDHRNPIDSAGKVWPTALKFMIYSSRQQPLIPKGSPLWLYGGKLLDDGSVVPEPAAPEVAEYRHGLRIDGRDVLKLQRNYWGRDFPALELARKELSNEAFIVLEKKYKGLAANGKTGPKLCWWKVQLLQEPGSGGVTDSSSVVEDFDSNARGWPVESNNKATAWVGDGGYHVFVDSEDFQAWASPKQFALRGDSVELRLESTWRAGKETGEYGLALIGSGKDSHRFLFFYVTRSGEAGVWAGEGSEPKRLPITRFRPTENDAVQSLVLHSRGLTYSVGKVVVYERKDFDFKNLRQLALVARGKQAVSFQHLSIETNVEGEEGEAGR